MATPEFILALRERIGTAPLWLPGVTGVVLHDDGRILLGRRVDTGGWALVSGILEPGEDPAVGLAREVLEETGVEVTVDQLASVTVTDEVVYPNGDRTRFLDLTFVCRPVSVESAAGARVADDESLEVAWFELDALPGDLTPENLDRLHHAIRAVTEPERGPYFVR
ncbi:NUDIX domain-containing protein [Cellulomonas sp. PhB143]|uniref:NUDIX hydrolase n=1 Tax=Cellulomonas sp. PhB143 TaxID=2485186 RepID=UPI000F471522|nr:NUDIX domain-containing protein [Cellulomonas sp. PhB143]ROS78892.1 ADP-ribose pyrophosphatase YjhB (NUDIX family) [Cellulomonas sp. PhB143]